MGALIAAMTTPVKHPDAELSWERVAMRRDQDNGLGKHLRSYRSPLEIWETW